MMRMCQRIQVPLPLIGTGSLALVTFLLVINLYFFLQFDLYSIFILSCSLLPFVCVFFVAEKVVGDLLASRPEYLFKRFLLASFVCRVLGFISQCELRYLGLGSHPLLQP